LRLVRDDEWLVLREPLPARLIGDDPVPVVTWLDVREEAGVEAGVETGVEVRLAPLSAVALDRAFTSAWPQTSQ
jgi:hypothetical protein